MLAIWWILSKSYVPSLQASWLRWTFLQGRIPPPLFGSEPDLDYLQTGFLPRLLAPPPRISPSGLLGLEYPTNSDR